MSSDTVTPEKALEALKDAEREYQKIRAELNAAIGAVNRLEQLRDRARSILERAQNAVTLAVQEAVAKEPVHPA